MRTHERFSSELLSALLLVTGAMNAHAGCEGSGEGWNRERPAQVPSDRLLEEAGAVIGEVQIQVRNIFDLANPDENNALFRTANRLHPCTRDWVVRRQLLFETGDRYDGRLIEESERILRANPFFYDAYIRPVRYADNRVDVEIITRDVWTLVPELSFGRSGGENTSSFGIADSNIAGTGKDFEISRNSRVDREETELSYVDRNLLGTRGVLGLLYSDNSDGDVRALSLRRPFFALDTRWATGGQWSDTERVEKLYDLGEVVDEFAHAENVLSAHYGWSRGLVEGWARRLSIGFTYERDAFASAPGITPQVLPENRTLSYPWMAVEWLEDDFRETRDQDQIGRTEDVFLGARLRLQLGWASTTFGADRDAGVLSVSGSIGFDPSKDQLLLLSGSGGGRLEGGRLRNGFLGMNARYYHRTSEKQMFYAAVDLGVAEDLDAENQLLLGGDTGLRGYPLRYQGGEARALLTLEHRLYTEKYPFRLVRVGAAAFFDIGRTWGRGNLSSPSLGWLKDVGIGLRLSPTRSSRQVVHVDLAFPLDGDDSIDDVQLILETKSRF